MQGQVIDLGIDPRKRRRDERRNVDAKQDNLRNCELLQTLVDIVVVQDSNVSRSRLGTLLEAEADIQTFN